MQADDCQEIRRKWPSSNVRSRDINNCHILFYDSVAQGRSVSRLPVTRVPSAAESTMRQRSIRTALGQSPSRICLATIVLPTAVGSQSRRTLQATGTVQDDRRAPRGRGRPRGAAPLVPHNPGITTSESTQSDADRRALARPCAPFFATCTSTCSNPRRRRNCSASGGAARDEEEPHAAGGAHAGGPFSISRTRLHSSSIV